MFRKGLLVGLFLLVSFAILFAEKAEPMYFPMPDGMDEGGEYYVVTRDAVMREGPSSDMKEVGRAKAGSVLMMLEEDSKWFLLNGVNEEGEEFEAWVYSRWVKPYADGEVIEEIKENKASTDGLLIPKPEELDENATYYVVKGDKSTIMREGAGSDNKEITRIAPGSVLKFLGEESKWYNLTGISEEGEEITGWIYSRWVDKYTEGIFDEDDEE